jgi:aryl-alcohol dehydrogenase-like predicted oxidoreductase
MFPIPGTRRIKYLNENIESIKIKFEMDEMEELDKLYKLVSGSRY